MQFLKQIGPGWKLVLVFLASFYVEGLAQDLTRSNTATLMDQHRLSAPATPIVLPLHPGSLIVVSAPSQPIPSQGDCSTDHLFDGCIWPPHSFTMRRVMHQLQHLVCLPSTEETAHSIMPTKMLWKAPQHERLGIRLSIHFSP